MTPDQYRREGAEAMQKAAAMYAECAPDRIPYRDHAGSFDWRDGLMDGARAAAEDIRAIDVDKVLAGMPPTDDAVAQLVEAARAALNYLENTEGEFGITLGSAMGLRAALAACKGVRDAS